MSITNSFDFFQNDETSQSETTTTQTATSIRSDYMDDEDDVWSNSNNTPIVNQTLSWDPVSQSPLITESRTSIFEPVLNRNAVLIHEHHLVHHLIQAVHGVPSIYFDNHLNQYKQLRILGVSATCIEPIIDRVLHFGTQLKKLEQLGHQFQSKGLTGMAFGSCLIEFHLNIQYTMMHEMSSIVTVLQLQQSLEQLFSIVTRLIDLCDSASLPFGASILNLLYNEIGPLDLTFDGSLGLYRDICFCFLGYTIRPYVNMLNQWLHMGVAAQELEDPYGEFFIQISEETNIYEVTNSRIEVIFYSLHYPDPK